MWRGGGGSLLLNKIVTWKWNTRRLKTLTKCTIFILGKHLLSWRHLNFLRRLLSCCGVQGLESELDSEISSLFSYDRDVTKLHRESDVTKRHRDVTNLHLMSPLEYAAMLKQVRTRPRRGFFIWKGDRFLILHTLPLFLVHYPSLVSFLGKLLAFYASFFCFICFQIYASQIIYALFFVYISVPFLPYLLLWKS